MADSRRRRVYHDPNSLEVCEYCELGIGDRAFIDGGLSFCSERHANYFMSNGGLTLEEDPENRKNVRR